MSGHGDDPQSDPVWRCPPLGECVKQPPYLVPVDDEPLERHRVVVQLWESIETGVTVRFALIQQTYAAAAWRDVVEVDNAHDVDVHLHQYCRSTFHRNGHDPEVLFAVGRIEDIETGYNAAYERVFGMWQENLRRWSDG